MSSIRQLAGILGVSTSTVSLGLRNDPRVRPELRHRINELAAMYHYRPNRLTQSIISGKSTTLGCILPNVVFTFYSRMLRGVLQQAFEESYRVITLETDSEMSRTRKAIHTLIEQRVDCILIANERSEPLPREAILEMRGHDIVPITMDSTACESPLDRVDTDEEQLAEMAVSHLYNMGHRAIVFIGKHPRGHLVGRSLAMYHAFRRKGMSTDNIIDFQADSDIAPLFSWLRNVTPSPTAVIAIDDRVAAKLMQQAVIHGIQIPRDLSILGCANLEIASLLTPQLTSLEQQPEEIGRKAVSLAISRLTENAKEEPRLPVKILVPSRLMERASCAPLKRPPVMRAHGSHN